MRRRANDRTARDERLSALAAVAGEFKAFRPARQVIVRVQAVPTIFPQFDHAVRVGGYPLERFTLFHGPSSHGKTTAALGIIKSFLLRDHYAKLIDAERTTPEEYTRTLLGDELFDHPGFYADKPRSYEATVKAVREWLTKIATLRANRRIPETTRAIIVVDSIRKLIPENILAKITAGEKKGGKGRRKPSGIDGMGGRAAQIKAAMNAAWMDELTPLLEDTRASMICIARETEDPDADMWSQDRVKVGGGKALFYDSSLVCRIERAGYVMDKPAAEREEGDRGVVYGERHRITIRKSKVAGKDDKVTSCYFHTSNGLLVPVGFDRARDVLELARRFEIVTGASWLSWGKKKIGQGAHQAVVKLTKDAGMLAELEAQVRAGFPDNQPHEHDAVTGEVA